MKRAATLLRTLDWWKKNSRRPPVRFRIVLDVTFPEADPWDSSEYGDHLDQLKRALETAPNVKCTDIVMRNSATIGTEDDYDNWRDGIKYDFSSFAPGIGEVLGVSCPVPAVDPGDLGRVWRILSKAEIEEPKEHVAIAVGRAMKTDSDASAVLTRTYILRVLQPESLVSEGSQEEVFRRAASIPLTKPLTTKADLTGLAALFR